MKSDYKDWQQQMSYAGELRQYLNPIMRCLEPNLLQI